MSLVRPAADSYDAAVEQQLDPGKVQAQFAEAHKVFMEGDHLLALRHVEELINGGAKVAGIHCLRAACLLEMGWFAEARQAIDVELAEPQPHPQIQQLKERLEAADAEKAKLMPQARTWATTMSKEVFTTLNQRVHFFEYRGIKLLKSPFDLAIYSMLIWRLKPRTIFEVGSFQGGSALWMGDMLNNYGVDGHIYSTDLARVSRVQHPRVTFMEGSGRELGPVFTEEMIAKAPRPFLVIEDADHSYETTSAVMNYFHPHLRSGEYLVVEDSLLSGGVQDAMNEFFEAHESEYVADPDYCDLFGYNMTWNLNGFIRKL